MPASNIRRCINGILDTDLSRPRIFYPFKGLKAPKEHNRLPQNAGIRLPTYAASHLRRTESTPHRRGKPQLTIPAYCFLKRTTESYSTIRNVRIGIVQSG